MPACFALIVATEIEYLFLAYTDCIAQTEFHIIRDLPCRILQFIGIPLFYYFQLPALSDPLSPIKPCSFNFTILRTIVNSFLLSMSSMSFTVIPEFSFRQFIIFCCVADNFTLALAFAFTLAFFICKI